MPAAFALLNKIELIGKWCSLLKGEVIANPFANRSMPPSRYRTREGDDKYYYDYSGVWCLRPPHSLLFRLTHAYLI